MIPALIGVAVAGGIAYALSDNDKTGTKVYHADSDGEWYCETTQCQIPASELPPLILRRLKNS